MILRGVEERYARQTALSTSDHRISAKCGISVAARDAGIAVKVGEDDKGRPVWDYQRVAFHAFRHACGTLLHAMEKRPAQAQAWLRHSQLMTTMNIYTHLDDAGLGGAESFDDILDAGALRGQRGATVGATEHPETAANPTPQGMVESAS